MKPDPRRCSREYRHGPHMYHAVGVAVKVACPGRGRRPLRMLLMFGESLFGR